MDNGVTLSNDSKSETPPFDPQAALTPEEISWVLDRAIAAEVGSSKYRGSSSQMDESDFRTPDGLAFGEIHGELDTHPSICTFIAINVESHNRDSARRRLTHKTTRADSDRVAAMCPRVPEDMRFGLETAHSRTHL